VANALQTGRVSKIGRAVVVGLIGTGVAVAVALAWLLTHR
jgi:hypothetical protein